MSDIKEMPELVIISGMSGAGRTETMHVFEDLGYYCVDNLPPSLIGELVNIVGLENDKGEAGHVAVVCDARARGFFGYVTDAIDELTSKGLSAKVIFLDADDDKLIARYKDTIPGLY